MNAIRQTIAKRKRELKPYQKGGKINFYFFVFIFFMLSLWISPLELRSNIIDGSKSVLIGMFFNFIFSAFVIYLYSSKNPKVNHQTKNPTVLKSINYFW